MEIKSPVGFLKTNVPTSSNKNQCRLPYLKGSESEDFKRMDVIHFAQKLCQYDVISFDIFDTLVLRKISNPQDLFMIVGNKLGLLNFKRIRSDAERKAREKAVEKIGTHEVSISDIYDYVYKRTGLDKNQGIKAELETEKEFCFANPYMMHVFKILKEQGKKVVITSDMYLPNKMMKELLQSCGYTDYDKLYVSCDYLRNKRSGELYKILLNDWKDKKIIHVGDNYDSDIVSANKMGIETMYYKNCHEIGNPYRADGMSDLVGSVYAGIINTHLHNGIKTYNEYYEYGFIYGGLYILGYCNWIHKMAKQQNVDKLLMLARDSNIYIKIFNRMFNDIPNEYVYWSRIANTKYSIENIKDDFLTRLGIHKANAIVPCSIGNILESFELIHIAKNLKKYNLYKEDILSMSNLTRFEEFLIDNFSAICAKYKDETKISESIFKNIIGNCKTVGVVDVGWLGSGPLGLKYLLEKKWKLCDTVKCYMAASTHSITSININELTNEDLDVYMFSRMYNRNLYDTHMNTNRGTNNIYFELFTQACHPSFSGYSNNNEYVFDVPEVKNYAITRDIQKGIEDFCDLYLDLAKSNPYLLNITGYDAYLPYRFIIRNTSLLKKIFKNVGFSRGVGTNVRGQEQETIEDIIKVTKS